MENIFLTRNQSRAIKGFLIFLIVLGHNAMFTKSLPGSFEYVYLFHVQAFFILPFLYGKTKNENFQTAFKKNFIRLYYPYILFFVALSLINYLVIRLSGQNFDLNALYFPANGNKVLYYISTFFTGNYYLIDVFTGMQYLWFLPVMFSMTMLMNLNIQKKCLKFFLMILGAISYVLFMVFMYTKPYNASFNFSLMLISPFAVLQGIGVWFLGTSFLYILNNPKFSKIVKYSSVIFIVLSILFIFRKFVCSNYVIIYYVVRFLMPLIFMCFIWMYRDKFSNIGILKKVGDLSFGIYIIHPILCNILYLIFKKYFAVNLINALVVQLIVFSFSYYVAYFINNISILQKMLFPRSWEDLKSIIIKKKP